MSILKKGSKGAGVAELQGQLNRVVHPGQVAVKLIQPALRVDRDFGDKTDSAVRRFQQFYGLVIDGKVGSQTRAALRRALEAPKPAASEPDKSAMAEPLLPLAPGGAIVARPPPNVSSLKLLATARVIDEIIWHCAATPEGKNFTVADIRAWHKKRGWSDIGYHYVVYLDGSIHLGRPIGQVGAHVSGRNARTIGAVYIGGVTSDGKKAKDTRTLEQKSSMLWLTAQLKSIHKGVRKVSGHNQYAAKACPSFDVPSDQLGR